MAQQNGPFPFEAGDSEMDGDFEQLVIFGSEERVANVDGVARVPVRPNDARMLRPKNIVVRAHWELGVAVRTPPEYIRARWWPQPRHLGRGVPLDRERWRLHRAVCPLERFSGPFARVSGEF